MVNKNNLCLERLLQVKNYGTKLHKQIARQLIIFYQQQQFEQINRVTKFANYFQISLSSVLRFTKSAGYPSFKHFIYDFELTKNTKKSKYQQNIPTTHLTSFHHYSLVIAKKIKMPIYIITSRRAKALGKMLNERLNDATIRNYLYHESEEYLKKFIQKIKNGTLIVISISGFSHIFSSTLETISKKSILLNVIVLTVAKQTKTYAKYDYFSLSEIINRQISVKSWVDCNLSLIDFTRLCLEIINVFYQKNYYL